MDAKHSPNVKEPKNQNKEGSFMTTELEKESKIRFIYEISTKFGRFVHNVECWTDEDIEHEISLLEELLAEEDL